MNGNIIIELNGISKSFGSEEVLKDIDLKIRENEFLTLLGPSGCGKTTTLRIIGGFESASKGELLFEGKDISGVPPYERQINTVFQKYALFPHLDVYGNIAFGLKIKKVPKDEMHERILEMLRLVDLKGFEKRNVNSLSGGQQQRVAIARALVNKPKVLLLDEPLGALDLKLRKEMQHELKRMQQSVGITFVYVTHDQEEALTMSDTVVVMDKGVIQQNGTPIDVYNEPKNAFVASFIGESNIMDGIMHEDFLVEFSGKRFVCVDRGFREREKVQVVVRPEDVEIVSPEKGDLTGVVTEVTFKGVHYEMEIRGDDRRWLVHSTRMVPVGSSVGIKIVPDNIHVMGGLS
ncbi:spermidine/putrescine ABC transporter ATP-binding protein [Youngiibacter multivorans]|uniref:Spermidine/putrescine import ATP-binding protein PotA n=1 Tax=Youngiibacter multivorans TaxID=937251 RepID=A0ABS4G1I3_9CLOT|nr:spermidine/putrescine ABC transporter ATP-binding protein [Youngiibacter multivorans]MBP1918409.1 spermidine/putrescine transport system ATP-binding protein [Youngiibacter multivorans]